MKIYNYAISFWLKVFIFGQIIAANQTDTVWSWQYHKRLSGFDEQCSNNKNEIVFSQKNVPSFSQLLFSWNALRPLAGHFTFYISVKDASNNAWGSWHQMVKWGADIQRSFRAKHDASTHYEYVRFEVDKGLANGFRVKVVANNGTNIALLKALHVNISDFSKFIGERSHSLHALGSVSIENVPQFSQRELDHPRNAGLCSPTACSMVVSYLTKQYINPIEFAEGAFDQGLDTYGSWPFNMAHAFERANGTVSFATSRLNSFKDIHRLLSSGMPVMVSVRGDLQGAPKTYENGHLVVVVGWDAAEKSVICHDPAFETSEQTMTKYPIDSFISAWERSRRLSYVAKPHSF